jgi:hypothetical protein
MYKKNRAKCKNITISLPHTTITTLEKIAIEENKPKSRVIDTAIKLYDHNTHKSWIRNYLK